MASSIMGPMLNELAVRPRNSLPVNAWLPRTHRWQTGPVMTTSDMHGASAWFDCRQVSHQMTGDHCLVIAEVESYVHWEVAPLLFHAGA